jgi:hypothetical protein
MELPPPYSHVQRAPVFGAVGLVLVLWMVVVGVLVEWHWLMLVPGLILLYLPFAFGSLEVEVRPGEARLRFGWIGPRKRIDLTGVREVRAVRNHWIYGWGIRYAPGGWMWNIWGLDAVELHLDERRRFRIGTDEPEALLRALREAGAGAQDAAP